MEGGYTSFPYSVFWYYKRRVSSLGVDTECPGSEISIATPG